MVYVRDRVPKMKDEDILTWAETEQRIVVTQDKDFGELFFRKSLGHAGILLLRLDEANADKKRDIVSEILDGYANQLPGRLSVFQDDRLRIR